MSESACLNPKVNSLMNIFLKRDAAQPLPDKKTTKKVKPNQDKLNDPLYQILSWRDDLQHPPTPPSHSYKLVSEPSILTADPEKWATNVQGIFVNVDWNTTSMESFKMLNFSNEVLSNGMAFVWGTKTNIGALLDHFEQMGYVYAENFAFVMLDRSKIPAQSQKQLAGNTSLLNFFSRKTPDSKLSKPKDQPVNDYQTGRVTDPSSIFLNSDSQYFSGSQRILYMFRKINKKQSLQLRHQRTSDVYFTIGQNDVLDWKAKEVVYKMIETLLINANYKEGQELKLMEVWAGAGEMRKGWVSVSEEGKERKENLTSQEVI